jgi:hypothetical protein
MSGRNQIWICLLALAVAALSMLPLEIQRRVIDDALQSADFELLAKLIVAHLLVLLVHGATKYALRMYQGWLSESAIR